MATLPQGKFLALLRRAAQGPRQAHSHLWQRLQGLPEDQSGLKASFRGNPPGFVTAALLTSSMKRLPVLFQSDLMCRK